MDLPLSTRTSSAKTSTSWPHGTLFLLGPSWRIPGISARHRDFGLVVTISADDLAGSEWSAAARPGGPLPEDDWSYWPEGRRVFTTGLRSQPGHCLVRRSSRPPQQIRRLAPWLLRARPAVYEARLVRRWYGGGLTRAALGHLHYDKRPRGNRFSSRILWSILFDAGWHLPEDVRCNLDTLVRTLVDRGIYAEPQRLL